MTFTRGRAFRQKRQFFYTTKIIEIQNKIFTHYCGWTLTKNRKIPTRNLHNQNNYSDDAPQYCSMSTRQKNEYNYFTTQRRRAKSTIRERQPNQQIIFWTCACNRQRKAERKRENPPASHNSSYTKVLTVREESIEVFLIIEFFFIKKVFQNNSKNSKGSGRLFSDFRVDVFTGACLVLARATARSKSWRKTEALNWEIAVRTSVCHQLECLRGDQPVHLVDRLVYKKINDTISYRCDIIYIIKVCSMVNFK